MDDDQKTLEEVRVRLGRYRDQDEREIERMMRWPEFLQSGRGRRLRSSVYQRSVTITGRRRLDWPEAVLKVAGRTKSCRGARAVCFGVAPR